MGEKQNGWNEYSRLVLAELEKLNNSVEELSGDITDLREEITKIKSIKHDIADIKEWRKDLSEVVSPTQLKEVRKDIDIFFSPFLKRNSVWFSILIHFYVINIRVSI